MTPYEVLGIPPDATREAITTAFRKLAKACHPDRNPGDPSAASRFVALNEAYKALIRDIKNTAGQPAGTVRRPAPANVIVRRNVFLTVNEAIHGGRKPVEGISGPCKCCAGSGRIRSQTPVECTACFGRGTRSVRHPGLGNIRIDGGRCDECAGTGKVTWFKCHECGGAGSVHMDACIVDIPPGTRPGERLTIPGGATDRRQNTAGDAEITVVIKDRDFRMVGNDIETEVHTDIWRTTLGGTVSVRLPSGETCRMAVPPETASETRFRLAGMGLRYTEETGDLIVVIKTRPLKLSEPGVREAMELLRNAAGQPTEKG